jgi:hypothetical protein
MATVGLPNRLYMKRELVPWNAASACDASS